jgi:hypothetical protein
MSEKQLKTYKPGEIIFIRDKGDFEIIKDLGSKLMIRRKDSCVKIILNKDRI